MDDDEVERRLRGTARTRPSTRPAAAADAPACIPMTLGGAVVGSGGMDELTIDCGLCH
jgi:hypothetical protein